MIGFVVLRDSWIMTELIDIATLASLGQHFVSHEDMERVKNPVASLQNDLELIKQFLVEKFGKLELEQFHNYTQLD